MNSSLLGPSEKALWRRDLTESRNWRCRVSSVFEREQRAVHMKAPGIRHGVYYTVGGQFMVAKKVKGCKLSWKQLNPGTNHCEFARYKF